MNATNQAFLINWAQQNMQFDDLKKDDTVIKACFEACSKCMLENIEIDSLNLLGTGSFGKVYSFPEKRNTKNTVVKLFKSTTDIKMILREVSMAKIPEHENIIQTFSCITLHTKESTRTGILLEAGSEELFHYMQNILMKGEQISDQKLEDFVLDIMLGVEWLHDHGVYHCDLKLDNILVTPGEILKLCDFGLAHSDEWKVREETTQKMGFTNFGSLTPSGGVVGYFGTPSFIPTRQLATDPSFVKKRDEWAMGCIFFILAYGTMLYTKCTNDILSILFSVKTKNGPQSFAQIYNYPPRCVENILSAFLRQEPKSVKEVLERLKIGMQ